jgi:4a-hydroxytetrahydrobiopterin dehydratase
MEKLSQESIRNKLQALPDWYFDKDALRRDWQFADFKEALSFINHIGGIAEQHNHHPEIFNVYNKVTLRFNTHDAGGITDKDFNIARAINANK